jgi:hypothetical protein
MTPALKYKEMLYYVMNKCLPGPSLMKNFAQAEQVTSHCQFARPTAIHPSASSKFSVAVVTASPGTLGVIITDQERNSDLRLLTLEYALHCQLSNQPILTVHRIVRWSSVRGKLKAPCCGGPSDFKHRSR